MKHVTRCSRQESKPRLPEVHVDCIPIRTLRWSCRVAGEGRLGHHRVPPCPQPTGQGMVPRRPERVSHACCQSAGPAWFSAPHHPRQARALPSLGPRPPEVSVLVPCHLVPCHLALQSLSPAPTHLLRPTKTQRSLSLKNKNFRLLKNNSQAGRCLCWDLYFPQKSPGRQGDRKGPAASDGDPMTTSIHQASPPQASAAPVVEARVGHGDHADEGSELSFMHCTEWLPNTLLPSHVITHLLPHLTPP